MRTTFKAMKQTLLLAPEINSAHFDIDRDDELPENEPALAL